MASEPAISQMHYQKLEQMYLAAPCNAYYTPSISIDEGSAEIRIVVEPKMFHAAGSLHGSVYFKMLDDAAFFSANAALESFFVVTANFNIQFLAPVTEGTLTARGRLITQKGRQFIAESMLYAPDDTIVATGSGSFIQTKRKLADIKHYGRD